MARNYYYLKLKDNFYESEELVLLQNMENGYLYSDILMKLYLKSLKNEGKIMFKDRIPYNAKMLAEITRHNVDVVDKAISVFKELGLIEILDNGAIYISDIQNYIGKSSTEADRKREYRLSIEEEKIHLLDKCPDKCLREIEIRDRDRDIEEKKEIYKEKKENDLFTKFWEEYPRKLKKEDVRKWFEKNKPNEELFDVILTKLKLFKKSFDWTKDNGQFVPYPITWLNQKRWEDDLGEKKREEKRII